MNRTKLQHLANDEELSECRVTSQTHTVFSGLILRWVVKYLLASFFSSLVYVFNFTDIWRNKSHRVYVTLTDIENYSIILSHYPENPPNRPQITQKKKSHVTRLHMRNENARSHPNGVTIERVHRTSARQELTDQLIFFLVPLRDPRCRPDAWSRPEVCFAKWACLS